MRKNITKEKLLKGECVFGLFCGINAPAIVEMMGLVGFDFVLIDGEHGPIDKGSRCGEHHTHHPDCR